MSLPTIGYIGLGNAGYPMAANLPRAGYTLVVRDADPEREKKFVHEFPSCRIAKPGKDAFNDCEVIITMLPNGKVVRDVVLGENGIGPALKAGTVIIDTSSSSPFDTRALGEELAAHKLLLVDSPITQEFLHAIHDAGATLMIGSDSEEAIQKAKPVLDAMSKYTFVMGRLGAGHAMKTLNNYVSVGSIIALCDALVAGQKFGLDPNVMLDVLNVGTGKNFSTAYSMKEEGLTRRFQTGYQLSLLVKDVKIAKEVIESTGFKTGFPDLALHDLSDGLKLVQDGACHTECLKSWESRAGVTLKRRERD
ncbi:2-hydroxy-3-oxopropionate reductase [Lineolata rhizophorae]|uniref:3-hydroxyisobutyrate dehydrogenase n=1 Tax=Lineolata rhizophorae TaxID=578093 RepID=A0A6A6NPQ0_9PEZI|nr:2-hydroxy-3-oxopropionate reductase [Lineolata rhizophorae]